ncbi:hypothetical protein PIB30_058389 [Stylosanthes scabra]|uniref:Uncharacterized protein n=1 Tax=Stylosanthes scabra TaxID=79078 RepID=A0ABU6ZIQ5_9FABA|nr:hypothetical protein [Stylosanthes scabra]
MSPSCSCTPLYVPMHGSYARAVSMCELTVGRVALGPICIFKRAPAYFNSCDRTGPKTEPHEPPNRACNRTSGPCARAMARKGKEVASASTPSRIRTTKNSSRGRDEGFPTKRFDSLIHYDRWKTMENRGITHERIIRFPYKEPDFMHDRVEGLSWGFMYNAFPTVNVTMVQEFYGNFSADHQTHVFLQGKRIPFSEEDICRHLGIDIELPPPGEDDMFKATVATEKRANWTWIWSFR